MHKHLRLAHLVKRTPGNEQGMVSIMVTMVLVIVIGLIVIGFAQISRRTQRVTLDQQLSTQAFYAAESGVNDIVKLINANNGTVYAKPTCARPSGAAGTYYDNLPSNTLSGSTNISYSCYMVNPTPPSLVYSDVGTSSVVVPLISGTGDAFTQFQFSWKTKTASATPVSGCPAGASSLPTTAAWGSSGCGYGVLRLDLVPTAGSTLTESTLASTDMTIFVVPTAGGSTLVHFAQGSSNPNDIIAGHCDNTACTLTIDSLSANQYYLRAMSLYENVALTITGSIATGPATFSGGQTVIDVTGKAQDVLRRVQARVTPKVGGTTQLPDYALESTNSICKRFSVMQGSGFQNSANSVTTITDATGNPLCH